MWDITVDEERDEEIAVLRSNGDFIAYPEYPMEIGRIVIQINPAHEFEAEYKIPYSIYTDRGQPAKGFKPSR